ncbi:MAG: hypothetical protein ACLR9W_07530 [Enterobacter hormaechei]
MKTLLAVMHRQPDADVLGGLFAQDLVEAPYDLPAFSGGGARHSVSR